MSPSLFIGWIFFMLYSCWYLNPKIFSKVLFFSAFRYIKSPPSPPPPGVSVPTHPSHTRQALSDYFVPCYLSPLSRQEQAAAILICRPVVLRSSHDCSRQRFLQLMAWTERRRKTRQITQTKLWELRKCAVFGLLTAWWNCSCMLIYFFRRNNHLQYNTHYTALKTVNPEY